MSLRGGWIPGQRNSEMNIVSPIFLWYKAWTMSRREKVIIRRADKYDPPAIAKIIKEGLEEFGLASRIRGRITVKPNVVMAHHKVTPSAYTRPEFLDGLFTALEGVAQKDSTITVAEKCGAAIPTSRMFRFDLIIDAYPFLFLSWVKRFITGRF